jgi:pilus assembly protein FimV
VLTSLGQPLQAEVEVSGTEEELETLSARIASPEAFKRANIEYGPLFSSLRVSVERRPSGAVLKIVGDKPVDEPFVDMLLELNWAGGRLVREYTFLLDPADNKEKSASQPSPVVQPTAPAPAKRVGGEGKTRQGAASPANQGAARPPASATSQSSTAAASGSGEHQIQRGDTLTRIAEQTMPPDATLRQMLAALYTNNRASFIGGDINRIKAGQTLKVPDAEQVKALSNAEVRRILSEPSVNFYGYRRQVAESVAAGPASESKAQQSVTGKITPKLEEPTKAAESGDKLKISKTQVANQGGAGAGKAEAAAATARAQALETDLVAREKALKDANERVAQLEKNVKELKTLVELKNQALSDLQKQTKEKLASVTQPAAPQSPPAAAKTQPAPAQAQPPAVVAQASPPAPAKAAEPPKTEPAKTGEETPMDAYKQLILGGAASPPSATASDSEKTAQSAPETEAAAAQSEPSVASHPQASPPVAPPAPAAEAPLEEEPGFLDNFGPLLAALGGVVVLVGGWLAYRSRKNKQEYPLESTTLGATQTSHESVIGPVGGQTVDTGSSVLPTDFSQSGLSSIDTDEGVDPVAEADVYMAYGRDAQAEEILLDALKADPSRTAIHIKLLEIYHQRNSFKQFENIATDLYTQTGGVGPDWAKAAELGAKLDPNNPLYRNVRKGAPAAAAAAMIEDVSFLDGGPAEPPPPQAEFPSASEPAIVRSAAQATPQAFGSPSPSQMQATWSMPGEIEQAVRAGMADAPQPAKAQAEDLGLDFNLDLDVTPQPEPNRKAFEASNIMTFEHSKPDLDDLPDVNLSASVLEEHDARLSTTRVTGSNAASAAEPLVLDLDGLNSPSAKKTPAAEELRVASSIADDAEAFVDLEKTNYDGSVLDFAFDVESTNQSEEDRAIDLSGIDLELNPPSHDAAMMQSQVAVATMPEGLLDEEVDVGEEVATKLELARAYEEMRDFEGARELLEEVLADGSSAQKQEAQEILGRLH